MATFCPMAEAYGWYGQAEVLDLTDLAERSGPFGALGGLPKSKRKLNGLATHSASLGMSTQSLVQRWDLDL